jgi:hypothetical protein
MMSDVAHNFAPTPYWSHSGVVGSMDFKARLRVRRIWYSLVRHLRHLRHPPFRGNDI